MRGGGRTASEHQQQALISIVPHPRTLRKARENVKAMVNDGVSLQKTRNYLHHYVIWWVRTSSGVWQYEALLDLFIRSCWEPALAKIAYGLLARRSTLSHTGSSQVG